jgi:SOS-response transcriptional repressor LexA
MGLSWSRIFPGFDLFPIASAPYPEIKSTWGVRHLKLKEAFYWTIQDISMHPTLSPDDLVLIDRRRRSIESGALYAIRHGNGIVIRRLIQISDWLIRIVSDNELYPAQEMNAKQLVIVGRVISLHRLFV